MRKLCLFLMVCMLLSVSCAYGEPGFETEEGSSPLDGMLSQQAGQTDPNEAKTAEENESLSSAIVLSGNLVWRIAGAEIICADTVLQQDIARLPIDNLLSTESNPLLSADLSDLHWLSLIARDENCVWLCASAADASGVLHAVLFDLTLSDSRIVVSAVNEATDTLASFFNDSSNWFEINMTGFSGGILISALDQNAAFNLYCWDVSGGSLTELGTESLMTCNAAVPYESGFLLAGFSLSADNGLDLRVLDMATGERTLLETVEIDSDPSSAVNYAWGLAENMLYYSIGNTAYRYAPGSGKPPVPFAVTDKVPVMNRLGVITGNSYVLYAEDGSLIWCDPHASLQSARIHIADASGNDELPELASGFNGQRKDYHVSVSSCDDDSVILEHLLSQSADYDIYVVSTDSGIYSALQSRGYFTDLNKNDLIRNAVQGMPDSVRMLAVTDDHLTGLPICTQNNTLCLNVKALQDLTGCSREEIPTDWPGMLRLLNLLAENGILIENSQYTVYESSFTPDLKQDLFALIMSDCLLWQHQSGASPDELSAVLLPALKEYNAIEWDHFGLPDETPVENMDLSWIRSNNQVPLLSIVQAEIAVMDLEDGVEYWPLSMNSECPRLIPETVSIMLINPWSGHAEGAVSFMEYVWDNLDVLMKMSLCPEMNEYIKNNTYDEDIAYLEQLISSYQDKIEKAETEEEAGTLRNEMEETKKFLNDYRENASWLTTEESISDYRTLSARFAPAVPEFWSADEEDAAVLQFLDGMMPAEQFVTQLVSALKMSLLEGE